MEIKPFAALRPRADYAARVAAPPYDVLSTEEARAMAADNPFSFLRADKAEIDLPPGTAYNDPRVYATARAHLRKWKADGVLIRDETPGFYIYRQTRLGRVQTGLAACVAARDYVRGTIKKHELTRVDKEKDRVDHIMACEAHTGPIFMAYRSQDAAKKVVNDWCAAHAPAYDFTAPDEVGHALWVVDGAAAPDFAAAFAPLPCLYIADGHHRSAAAVLSALEGGASDFLAVLFPHDELEILDYNRLVKDLNGLTREGFLQRVADDFTIETARAPVKPAHPHEYGLYLNGQWWRLTYKKTPPTDVVEGLAVSVLQDALLSPVLGIADPRTDKRIDFVGGARGAEGLTTRVDSGEMALAFTLCPTSLDELLDVADAGRIMPPKSTWFEPKLLSGLLIHTWGDTWKGQ